MGKVGNEPYVDMVQQARSAVDDASFQSKTGRDAMENFQNDMASIFNVIGGVMKGIMGMLGKGGGKGGGGKGKGG